MTVLHLELENHPEIATVEGTVTEKKFVSINRDHSPCKNYPKGNVDFIHCCKTKILDTCKEQKICTIPGIIDPLSLN